MCRRSQSLDFLGEKANKSLPAATCGIGKQIRPYASQLLAEVQFLRFARYGCGNNCGAGCHQAGMVSRNGGALEYEEFETDHGCRALCGSPGRLCRPSS